MDSATFIKNRVLRRNIIAYSVLVALLVGLMGYYSYQKFTELFHKTELINRHHEALAEIEPLVSAEESEYRKLQETSKVTYQEIDKDLSFVFPNEEHYTNLTRELDAYFLNLSKVNNTFFVSNLQYGAPRLDDTKSYFILPINMTVKSSRANFFNFLNYTEQSGNLTDKTRILDLQSIRLNFKESLTTPTADPKDDISYNVSMNTYFQKPIGYEGPTL